MQLLVDFSISDQVYAKAKVPVTDTVNLWLGANVMLEYPLEEAKTLLVCKESCLCCIHMQMHISPRKLWVHGVSLYSLAPVSGSSFT